MKKGILFLLMVFFSFKLVAKPEHKIVGYYPSWAMYRNPSCKPADIPGELLTHINYAFAKVDASGKIHLVDPWADVEYRSDWNRERPFWGHFYQLVQLKEKYPHLKTLISIGGWTLSDTFSALAADPEARTRFAKNCVEFCKKYKFDGVDLDWEFPGFAEHQGRAEDTKNFTLLLQEVFTEAKANSPQLLVTIAAPAGDHLNNIEIEKIHPFLDWINLMTYDFHGPWGGINDQVTNHQGALYPTEIGHSKYNVDSAIKEYLVQGVPKEKLIVGIPFYGRSYAEVQSVETGLHSSYGGVGSGTTAEKGIIFFSQIASLIKKGYCPFWDAESHASYLYHPDLKEFISYDNLKVMKEKCEYVKTYGLGGVMVWELANDTIPSWEALRSIYANL